MDLEVLGNRISISQIEVSGRQGIGYTGALKILTYSASTMEDAPFHERKSAVLPGTL